MGLLVALDERRDVTWARDAASDLPRRSRPRATDTEVEACARCHSSRTRMFDDDPPGSPLLGSHLPALLTSGSYHADGQLEGEVYEYGSFVQSRMAHEGVTCSDCHEPHRGSLRAGGNALCLQCHDATRYDTVAHHHHANGSPASKCVTCHMPAKTFMVVHVRRDHSFRVPRPDLADSLGTPGVCASCHAGKSPGWALEKMRAWFGHAPAGFQRFAGALAAARGGAVDARERLLALAADHGQPPIARATAVSALGAWPDPGSIGAIRDALEIDPEWIPASANLADLLRATNRDGEGESVLRAALARQPGAAALHYALGLCLVRQQRRGAALEELARAASLAPDDPRFALAYALALDDAGRAREALAAVERGLARRPGDRALAELSAQLGGPGRERLHSQRP
jgi:predicted CXXCH cytochrome family protein